MVDIGDRPLVVSVSGGKDSTAMALWLIEQGLRDRCTFVFADTRWEHPDLYRYLDEVLEPLLGKLHRVTSEKHPEGMAGLVKHKGVFPSRQIRFCTQELKVKPLIKFLKDHPGDPINVVGIRAAESERRSKMFEWETGGPIGCDTWRPLISWTVQDVIDIHTRNNIAPCSLYLRAEHPSSRVGCYPCIMSRKSEILAVAKADPWRIDEIRELEHLVGLGRVARLEAKGEKFDTSLSAMPGFFQERMGRGGRCWPIDDVVEWAKTSRGGRQFELFHTSNPGCQMWGLCDVGEASE
jgi:3'-phosphoadenosine 5'-phosphosulfate sulfotransferase (PAPS reductase)/FAD synthetase